MKYIVLAMVALGLAGCDLFSSPSRPDLYFSYTPVEEPGAVIARRQVGGIEVLGVIPTPCTPYGVRGTMTVSGNNVELRVTGREEITCPDAEPGYLEYFAAVSLRVGTYRVRVIHEWPDADWPQEVALDTQVTVSAVE